jgi:phage shock protein A
MLPDPSSDLALQVLRLEQRLESYQRLHQQELEELRRALAEVKDHVLVLAATAPHRPIPAHSGEPDLP